MVDFHGFSVARLDNQRGSPAQDGPFLDPKNKRDRWVKNQPFYSHVMGFYGIIPQLSCDVLLSQGQILTINTHCVRPNLKPKPLSLRMIGSMRSNVCLPQMLGFLFRAFHFSKVSHCHKGISGFEMNFE